MKKNKPAVTIIVGFIAGLVISGILIDIIGLINNSADRVLSAWYVSKSEKYIAVGNFSRAAKEYEKALKKIKPNNKKLLAKIKNNLALIVFTEAEKKGNKSKIKESLEMFEESLNLYKALNDSESAKQVEINIKEAKFVLESEEK
ncbi:MAG: hypothetical protein LBD46_08270 [Endomicrobium sp.]|jgi:tetratricopeptide (TPR) repeat protein|nr:hypothetical protein [Endomicrobium sp.]